METNIRYYGILTEIASYESELIKLGSGTLSIDLQSKLIARHPGFGEIPLVFFQNQKLCAGHTELLPGVEIDCMPPFAGG